jgi:hypothetical protein
VISSSQNVCSGLFNDAVSHTIQVPPVRLVNNELQRIWKEALMA